MYCVKCGLKVGEGEGAHIWCGGALGVLKDGRLRGPSGGADREVSPRQKRPPVMYVFCPKCTTL